MGDTPEPRDVIEALKHTWNRRDWAGFSALFAEGAYYVTGAGVRLAGRSQIHTELLLRAGKELPSEVTINTESLMNLTLTAYGPKTRIRSIRALILN